MFPFFSILFFPLIFVLRGGLKGWALVCCALVAAEGPGLRGGSWCFGVEEFFLERSD